MIKKIFKVIYLISIAFLVIWIVMPLFWYFTGLEFATDDFKSGYQKFLFGAVPAAVLIITFKNMPTGKLAFTIITRVIALVLVGVSTFFIMILIVFSDMCAWTNTEILFEHKAEPSTLILSRAYGCGAADSGPPIRRIHKLEYFSQYLIRKSEIDTSEINKNDWIKVPPN